MDHLDKIIDIISRWDKLGQGVFFLLVIFGVIYGIKWLVFYFTVLFRGWPTNSACLPKDEDDD